VKTPLYTHVIKLPRKIVIGKGVRKSIPQYLNALEIGKNILIVTGPNLIKLYGKEIIQILEDGGFNVNYIVTKSTNINYLKALMENLASEKYDVILGFGGGKSIDTAKYVATNIGKPFVSVPTAVSHDGIASPFASIKGLERPTSIKVEGPIAIIADTEIIVKAPYRLLAAGVGDLVAKFTAVLDWKLAHKLKNEYYGDYAASLALLSAKHVINYASIIHRGTEESVRIVIEALISSGIAMHIAGSSRPASGSEHLFSHALDIVAPKPALHGEQCGVGTIMMAYLHGKNWRKIKKTLKEVGAPTTAKELGIDDYHIIKALTIAHKIRPERYTILGETGLTWEAAENLARKTGVIS